MDKITFDTLKISPDGLLDKINADIKQGVTIDSSNVDNTKLTKVWTDSEGWQFVIIGLHDNLNQGLLKAVEVQSTGQSVVFLRMKIEIQNPVPSISFQKLSLKFAQIEEVTIAEAQVFVEEYMKSKFNRTLTSELFDELSHDKNYFKWLNY